MSDEITQLRAEIATLRKDLDRVLERLGQVGNIYPGAPHHHLGYDANYLRTNCVDIYEHAGGPLVEIRAEDETAGIYSNDGKGECHARFRK